jgi:hypothetical protein
MANQWYFAWDDHKFGPFSALQLQELAVLGRLQPSDIVWKNDMEKGVVAEKVQHLFGHPPVESFAALIQTKLRSWSCCTLRTMGKDPQLSKYWKCPTGHCCKWFQVKTIRHLLALPGPNQLRMGRRKLPLL